MRSVFLVLAVATATTAPSASLPIGGGEPRARESVLQIQAREVWTSGGERIPDGVVVVADGKIRAVGGARLLDPAQPLIRHDGVLTAGMVACRTWSGARAGVQDDTRAVLPAARAAAAVDADSRDLERLLAAGITSVGIAPGPESLVGGLACVTKTTGRVMEDEALLALSLSSSALGRSTARSGFSFGAAEDADAHVDAPGAPEDGDGHEHHHGAGDPPAEFVPDEPAAGPRPLVAQRDGGPEWSARTRRGTREPTSYAGALAILDALLARGEGAFGRAKEGELPVSIDAWERHEVLRAARFAAEHRLAGSIRGAPLAGDPDVVAALKASGLGVVVGPYTSDQTRRSLASVRHLAEAGVPVAFALDGPARPAEELRLSAVRALAAGASPESLWKALTEDAARLAGVGDRVGKLAPGQEADLVLWSGDPLDLRSRPVAVYVDGARAWSAAPAPARPAKR